MKAVIQRALKAHVQVDNKMISEIKRGLVVLIGIEKGDTQKEAELICSKIAHLRIFEDNEGKMNLSLLDAGYELLVISQFTLMADCKKGRRPSFESAMEPGIARQYYEDMCKRFESEYSIVCQTGVFGADMQVSLINDGPVTIILDTKEL